MKEIFYEVKLVGQFSKDIEKAQNISDKEYQKRRKKRYKKDVELYSVNSLSKFSQLIKKTMEMYPEKMSVPLFRHLSTQLDRRRFIRPELAQQIHNLTDSEISNIIKKLGNGR